MQFARKRRFIAAGFTLIEILVVIVILGILAATALPRFVNMQDDAARAAADGVAAALTSGANINYSAFLANSARTDLVRLSGTYTLGNAGALLGGAGLAAGFSIGSGTGTDFATPSLRSPRASCSSE